jgi:hypothetical protein
MPSANMAGMRTLSLRRSSTAPSSQATACAQVGPLPVTRGLPWRYLRSGSAVSLARVGADDDEQLCQTFVQMWAEAVMRQVQRVNELRAKAARDGRNYERLEEWSPTLDDLAANSRAQWTEEQTLVWAAHQLEKWAERLAAERFEAPPATDEVLANLRSALEHPYDADFTNEVQPMPGTMGGWVYSMAGSAVPGEGKKNRALRALPSSRLDISTVEGVGLPAFGLIDVDELERRATAYVRKIEDALMADAEDRWIEMSGDR